MPKYQLVDLGLQESDQSEAVAINDKGQVAGMYWMLGNKYYFLWEEKKGISLIDLPDTATIAVLNHAGQIAGYYKDSNDNDRGFFWDPRFGFFDIGTLGGIFTRVYDMNDFGQIVGESESSRISLVDGRREQRAFLWQDGSMIDLGSITGDLGVLGDRSVATSINNRGQIIGTSNSLIAHKGKFIRTYNRSVFWQNGVLQEIDPTIEPQYSACAYAVNNKGLACYQNNKIGYFAVDLATGEKIEIPYAKNFDWDPEISDKGDIYFFTKDHLGKKMAVTAFFIRQDIGKFSEDQNSYVYVYFGTAFDNPREWRPGSFAGARDFNSNHWFVGEAMNTFGERHAVLLVPINE